MKMNVTVAGQRRHLTGFPRGPCLIEAWTISKCSLVVGREVRFSEVCFPAVRSSIPTWWVSAWAYRRSAPGWSRSDTGGPSISMIRNASRIEDGFVS